VDQFQAGVARVVALALEALQQGQPLLMFCAAGKDRTGLVAALLELCAGASDEQVASDYARCVGGGGAGGTGQVRLRWRTDAGAAGW
jgi:protein tyrosine/serine phosphatase